jgi:hypothetical protein
MHFKVLQAADGQGARARVQTLSTWLLQSAVQLSGACMCGYRVMHSCLTYLTYMQIRICGGQQSLRGGLRSCGSSKCQVDQ